MAETLNVVGPAFLVNSKTIINFQFYVPQSSGAELEDVSDMLNDILQQKALCQQDPDQEDEPSSGSEDQAEYDSVLISAAGDVVAALANAFGADFQQPLHIFLPLIMKYYVSIYPFLFLLIFHELNFFSLRNAR
jgi:importin-4